jgi:rhodanese-related sulfurtransferase
MKSTERTGKLLLRLLLLTACLLLAACSATITRSELSGIIQEKPASTIVDVRSSGEYAADHLPGAVNIPFYSIISGLRERGVSPEKPLYIYCEHGPRAGLAGLTLYLYGYREVYSLEGHMQGWRSSGLAVEKVRP